MTSSKQHLPWENIHSKFLSFVLFVVVCFFWKAALQRDKARDRKREIHLPPPGLFHQMTTMTQSRPDCSQILVPYMCGRGPGIWVIRYFLKWINKDVDSKHNSQNRHLTGCTIILPCSFGNVTEHSYDPSLLQSPWYEHTSSSNCRRTNIEYVRITSYF